MPSITPDRLGVCSWSLQPESPADLITKLQATGILRTQLALNPLINTPELWGDAPAALSDAGRTIISGMFGTVGEDYTTLDTIRGTGGIVPDEHWDANLDTAIQIADLAGSLALPRVSFHAGFIPHEPEDPTFARLADRVRTIAELFAAKDITLMMETGQETAASLNAFLDAVEQPNLGVNFDPANMILYGMGDPIASLQQLMPHVRQVHIKDANPADTSGDWGTEVCVGTGTVDWQAFINTLNDAGYPGDLVIEREADNQRVDDVKTAAAFLMSL